LSRYLNINLSGITRVSCLNNVVYLQLSPGKERCEHTEINLPTMSFAQIEPYLDCNALILNFTSGYELNLETVERVLELFTGIIYIDIHSLTLGIDENRHRYRRKIPQWHRWIIGAHFIQLTADEAWSFYTGEDFNLEAAKTVGREISKFAKIACIMTFGPEGVLVFTKEGEFKVDVVKVEAPVDTTGCGDVLGASFLWRYLETEETLNSIEFAVQMATKKCTFSGIEKMQRLKEI
jgi:sugar/nucleoside kinase (ribokinase family)